MNYKICQMIHTLHQQSLNYVLSTGIRNQLIYLNFLTEQNFLNTNISKEIERVIFELMVKIADDKKFPNSMVSIFNDIVVNIIDIKISKNEDIFDITNIFDKMKISLNTEITMMEM